ncbi:MAG TPA: hypothetical protein VIR58_16790 [Acidimicrobiales bacterium]
MPWVTMADSWQCARVRLALLPKASSNRVYGESAFDLTVAELALVAEAAGLSLGEIERSEIGGVDHLIVEVDDDAAPLTARAIAVLSNLSSLHALYELRPDGLLRPLEVAPLRCQDEDVVTIQRYPGKTNEAFTHLLVNAALAAAHGGFERLLGGGRLRLLDPACGRGTSLNRAIVYGLDAVGIEHDDRDVDAYETFLLTWLKDKRLKHAVERARLRKGRPAPARRLVVTYGGGKDRSTHHKVEVVADDTARTRDHVGARSIDLLVCDLPYGVQHGSRPVSGELQRGPADLLRDALPAWVESLRPGGGVALGWNTKTLSRSALVERLMGSGLELARPADDTAFVHRVDRSITRDVVVARRPA